MCKNRIARFVGGFITLTITSLSSCWVLYPDTATSADSALAMCKSRPLAAQHVVMLQRKGSPKYLVIADKEKLPKLNCQNVTLQPDANWVRWLGALPLPAGGHHPSIGLTVREGDGAITAVDWQMPNVPRQERQLVPLKEVLPVFETRTFGDEGRASTNLNGATAALTCNEGHSPAGLIIPLGAPAAGAALKVVLEIEATAGFRAQVVDAALEATASGRLIDGGSSQFEAPLPPASSINLIVSCPLTEGVLKIRGGRVEGVSHGTPPRRSAWAWEPEIWKDQGDALIDVSVNRAIAELYISLPIESGGVEHQSSLEKFVATAHLRGLRVLAVEGDPGMIWEAGTGHALSRAAAVAAYNRPRQRSERLDGLQYDIEPYLQPGFASSSETFWLRWARTLLALQKSYGDAIEVVVPYWMLSSPGGQEGLELLGPEIKGLVIMAYRTKPAEIIEAAAPLLSWATKRDLPARVALESGMLAQEHHKVYVKAPEGDLHVIRFDDVAAVVLFDRVSKSDAGRAYKLSHIVAGQPNRVSFANDTAALLRAADILEHHLIAWPAFAGLALHGLGELTLKCLQDSTLGVRR
jgi:hypothetical protein